MASPIATITEFIADCVPVEDEEELLRRIMLTFLPMDGDNNANESSDECQQMMLMLEGWEDNGEEETPSSGRPFCCTMMILSPLAEDTEAFETMKAAFQLIKQKLCSAPILALPEESKDFILYCDASIKGLATMLMQIEKHYSYGTRCTVFTDHKNLQHILNQKELNMRQHCWLELLSYYGCEIRYHPRKANVVAHALSWKEREQPLRVRALVMTIVLDLP
ncbi:putative reverse transcriptase domain-containing protein [Tanacetum coccineum]|uniref:Reverse transcriptase domain-containing protein n=1 Tax=Tanacetum coccineum TaxID=301880 RepID=A0ABQ4WGH0_9ASTR